MDKICGLKLKVPIIICRDAIRFFSEIAPCAHHVIFITEFVLLIKIPPLYEVDSFDRKWHAPGGISKIFLTYVNFKLACLYFDFHIFFSSSMRNNEKKISQGIDD
jgi:hypothetical protein